MRRVAIGSAVLVLAVVAVSVFVAVAQEAQPPRQPRRDMATQWKERLNLTDQQVEQVRALTTGMREKMRDAADAEARRAITAQYQKDFRALLTPEQQVKYDAELKSEQDRAELRRLQGMDTALRGLELTAAQNERLAVLQKARDEKIKAAYNAYKDSLKGVLTPEQMKKFEENLSRPARFPGAAGTRVRGATGGRQRGTTTP